jgi:hypothetical protein
LNRNKKEEEETLIRPSTHLQILNGAVMNITRSVIEVLVAKNKTISPAFELAIFSPVKHSTRTGFIWGYPGHNHTLAHIISLCYMHLQTQILQN